MSFVIRHPFAGYLRTLELRRGSHGKLARDGAVEWRSLCFGGTTAAQAASFGDADAATAFIAEIGRQQMQSTNDGGSDFELSAGLVRETQVVAAADAPEFAAKLRPLTPGAAAAWTTLQSRAARLRSEWAGPIVQWADAGELRSEGSMTVLRWMALADGDDVPVPLPAIRDAEQAALLATLGASYSIRWPRDLSPLFEFAEYVCGLRLRTKI